MFPLWDDNSQERTRPGVTYTIIAVNLLIFLLELGAGDLSGVERQWGAIPAAIVAGDSLWTLFTNLFVHGGWMHVLGNMWFLWTFGDNVEDRLGHLRYAGFYVAAGLAGSAGQILITPHADGPMLGASGAIAGVMAAYVVLFPSNRVKVLVWRLVPWSVPAWAMIGLWLLLQLGGVVSTEHGTAWGAHLGGFAAGALMVAAAPETAVDEVKAKAAAASEGGDRARL
jgi:membrane associated rhomboid family serine protease